jgi:hypothetical protein
VSARYSADSAVWPSNWSAVGMTKRSKQVEIILEALDETN